MDLHQLHRETLLPLDTVKGRWKTLGSLSPAARRVLDSSALAAAWKVTPQDALSFLWSCAALGGINVRWQTVAPESGWVTQESSTPQTSSGRVVLSLGDDEYSGSWEAYADLRQVNAKPRAPSWFKTLQPGEVGRLDIEVVEGESYEVICLENGASMTLTVDTAKITGGRSFIGKMKQYRAQKFLLGLQGRVIDLRVTSEGFESEQALIAPGNLVYWLENLTDGPVAVQIWKGTVPKLAVVSWHDELKQSVGLVGFRRYWSTLKLANGFQRPVDGVCLLTLDFTSTGSFYSGDDAQLYAELEALSLALTVIIEKHSGSLVARFGLTLTAALPSALHALEVAVAARRGKGNLVPCLTLSAGRVLLTDFQGVPSLFGAPLHRARLLEAKGETGELWLAEGFHQLEGVSERLIELGLAGESQMVRLGTGQETQAYRIASSGTSPA